MCLLFIGINVNGFWFIGGDGYFVNRLGMVIKYGVEYCVIGNGFLNVFISRIQINGGGIIRMYGNIIYVVIYYCWVDLLGVKVVDEYRVGCDLVILGLGLLEK